MEKIKVIRSTSYTVLDNEICFDKGISLIALGLHRYIMTMHTAGREITVKDLIKYRNDPKRKARDGRYAVENAMNQLIDAGYCSRKKTHDVNGFVTWEYRIAESPLFKKSDFEPAEVDGLPNAGNLHLDEKPNAGNLHLDSVNDLLPNAGNLHSILSNNSIDIEPLDNFDITQPSETKKEGNLFVAPPPPPAGPAEKQPELKDQDAQIRDVKNWVSDNQEWIRCVVDQCRYDETKAGVSVEDQILWFCSHFSACEDVAGTRAFNYDAVGYFRRNFRKWLLRAKTFAPPKKNAAPATPPPTYHRGPQPPSTNEVYHRPKNILRADADEIQSAKEILNRIINKKD